MAIIITSIKKEFISQSPYGRHEYLIKDGYPFKKNGQSFFSYDGYWGNKDYWTHSGYIITIKDNVIEENIGMIRRSIEPIALGIMVPMMFGVKLYEEICSQDVIEKCPNHFDKKLMKLFFSFLICIRQAVIIAFFLPIICFSTWVLRYIYKIIKVVNTNKKPREVMQYRASQYMPYKA